MGKQRRHWGIPRSLLRHISERTKTSCSCLRFGLEESWQACDKVPAAKQNPVGCGETGGFHPLTNGVFPHVVGVGFRTLCGVGHVLNA